MATTHVQIGADAFATYYNVVDSGSGAVVGQVVERVLDAPTLNRQTLEQNLRAGMAAAENALANWATLSAAQKDTAQKAALAGVVRLTRVVLNVLDAAP